MPPAATSISEVNHAFEAAIGSGNSAAAAAVYTKDGQVLPPNSAPISGKTGIQAFWQGAIDNGVAAVTLATDELEVHGDTAVEVGHGSLFTAGGEVIDEAKYIVVWKRENGEWRWHRDIYNSNQPG